MICLALLLSIFSSIVSMSIFQFRKMDCQLEQARDKALSTRFISESFCNTCRGRGFSSMEDWALCCQALWQLDQIKWGECETENLRSGERLMRGEWSGACGSGEVYCRMRRK